MTEETEVCWLRRRVEELEATLRDLARPPLPPDVLPPEPLEKLPQVVEDVLNASHKPYSRVWRIAREAALKMLHEGEEPKDVATRLLHGEDVDL